MEVKALAVSPDNKYFASGGTFRTLHIWDIKTGENYATFGSHVGHPPNGECKETCKGHHATIIDIEYNKDGSKVASCDINGNIVLWDVAAKKMIMTLKYEGKYEEFKDIAFVDGENEIYALHNRGVARWNLTKGKVVEEKLLKELTVNNNDVLTVAVNQTYDNFFIANNYQSAIAKSGITFLDQTTGRSIHPKLIPQLHIKRIDFSPDDKSLLTAIAKRKKFGISTSKEIKVEYGEVDWNITNRVWDLDAGIHHKRINEEYKDFVFNQKKNSVYCFSRREPGQIVEIDMNSYRTINTLHPFDWIEDNKSEVFYTISNDGKFILMKYAPSDDKAKFILYDIEKKQQIWSARTKRKYTAFDLLGFNDKCNEFVVSYIVEGDYKYMLYKRYELANPKKTVKENKVGLYDKYDVSSSFELSFDTKYILKINEESQLRVLNTDSLNEYGFCAATSIPYNGKEQTFIRRTKDYKLSANSKLLSIMKWNNDINIIDLDRKEEIQYIENAHNSMITAIGISNDNKIVASGSSDNTIKFWNTNNGAQLASLYVFGNNEYVLMDKANNYLSSKNVKDMVHFVVGTHYYSFDNFDLFFNRPDLVLNKLGVSNPKLLSMYEKAYRKRVRKMGFDPDELSLNMHLPEVKIKNKDIPLLTNEKTLKIDFQAKDTKFNIQRINLYVNGVPIYGSKGMLVNQKTKDLSSQVAVELSQGKNIIQLSAHNTEGLESLKESIEIVCTGPSYKPSLYIAAVGVSKYQDKDYSLQYAAKDTRDIISTFKSAEGQYFDNVHTMLVNDEKAVKGNIMQIKTFFDQSNPDDYVILFFAGHGLLDDNLDYYYATQDINFNNPSEKGLVYEQIEYLIDSIPARKKLLFIDACHSGEIDKEETYFAELSDFSNEKPTVDGGKVSARGFRKVETQGNDEPGIANSFELMNELFNDLRRGTGAVVISSASGAEFAFESDEWKNGVFTYALLEGLKTQKANLNNDNKIHVSELKDYISKRVQELTNGLQNPTSRRENLEFDFRVW